MTDALLFILLTLTAYRVTRLIALDDLPPLVAVRDRFTEVVSRRHGADWASGIGCAWCSGFWVSCAVVGAVWHFRSLPLPGLWFCAVSAAVGMLAMLTED